MSSTTSPSTSVKASRRARREGERGQVLFIFTGGLVAFLAVCALVFDVGQNLLDWRAQRNAADGAALAGARYIAGCVAPYTDPATCGTARAAALRVAALNGYGDTDGDGIEDSGHVEVHIPPTLSDPAFRRDEFLEVTIHTDRPSFFAAVLGVLQQNVNALAVAGNSSDVAPPYSMLALNPDCDPNPSGQVGGNGNTTVGGSVVVNSNCDGALQVNGNGQLHAPECDVVGTAQESGSNAVLDCNGNLVEGFDGAGDPLGGITPGAQPGVPQPTEILAWTSGGTPTIPAGCPGSTSAISYAGSTLVAADTANLPLFAIGDLAVVHAYRAGGTTPPDLPAGWTNIQSGNNDGNASRVGYRILDGSEITTGTWTNATAVQVIVLHGQDTDNPIGATATTGAAGGTLTSPALSGMQTDGHSWVVAFGGASADANVRTLAGTTALSNSGTPTQLALHYAANRVSWASTAYGGTATGPNRTEAVEIHANPNPSTAVNPAGCTLNGAGAGRYNIYRLHPGTYYGGIRVSSRARVYLAPGTYWIGGGGIKINGSNGQLVSVNGAASTTPGRGVFIYVTEDEYYHDACAAGTAPANACIDGISTNGNSSNECPNPIQPSLASPYTPNPPTQPCQWVHLEPTDSPIANLLVFVDRNLPAVEIFFNGNAGKLELAGTIYNPNGNVKVNGGAGDSMAAQIIAYTFSITGNGGFTVTYDADGVVHLAGVGLVQ